MGTCDKCKYWDKDEALSYGKCKHPKLDSNASEDYEIDGAMVRGYDADDIETGPKFGCIHWSEKN